MGRVRQSLLAGCAVLLMLACVIVCLPTCRHCCLRHFGALFLAFCLGLIFLAAIVAMRCCALSSRGHMSAADRHPYQLLLCSAWSCFVTEDRVPEEGREVCGAAGL